jgi:hypothetical protein
VKKRQKPKPILTGFVNNVSGEYFEAYLIDVEDIEGRPFYVLRMKDHPRIVKMAMSALKKLKQAVDNNKKM